MCVKGGPSVHERWGSIDIKRSCENYQFNLGLSKSDDVKVS